MGRIFLCNYKEVNKLERDIITTEEWIKEKLGNKKYESRIQDLNLENLLFPYYMESMGICTPRHYFSE